MSFVSRVFQIADPRGRCNRKALLGIAIALLSVQALAFLLHSFASQQIVHLCASAIELICLWIATSAAIKRLHDLGYSGWWVPGSILALFTWMLIASFVCFLTLGSSVARVGSPEFLVYAAAAMVWPIAATIWLHFAKGQEGPNRYGPEPDETGLATPVRGTPVTVAEPQPV